MAIIYLDPTNGNDLTGDGLSFATAYKTIGQCHSVATDGDEIRIIKSNDPTAMGMSATWTKDSQFIQLASAVSQPVWNGATVWTKNPSISAVVTMDTNTRSDSRKYTLFQYNTGTSVPSGAYRWGHTVTPFTNYAGYQQLSLILRFASGNYSSGALTGQPVVNQFEIVLCSDTGGTTPIPGLVIPLNYDSSVSGGMLSGANRYVVNLGIDIGTVQSIAIWSKSSFYHQSAANVTVEFMNIEACLPPSNPNCLTHKSIIGKNLPTDRRFYAIRYLEGTNISIGTGDGQSTYGSSLGSSPPSLTTSAYLYYPGVTEVITPYVLDPLRPGDFLSDTTTSALKTLTKGLKFSGGWINEVTQGASAYSWFQSSNIYLESFFSPNDSTCFFSVSGSAISGRRWELERLGFSNMIQVIQFTSTAASMLSHSIILNNIQTSSIGYLYYGTSSFIRAPRIVKNFCNLTSLAGPFLLGSSATSSLHGTLILNNTLYSNFSSVPSTVNSPLVEMNNFKMINGPSSGMGILNTRVKATNIETYMSVNSISGKVFNFSSSTPPNEVVVDGIITNYTQPFNYPARFPLNIMRFQGNSNDHRNYIGKVDPGTFSFVSATPTGTIFSEFGADRNTPTGLAWKLSPMDATYFTQEAPLRLSVLKLYIGTLDPVTVSVWAKRDNLGISGRLILPSGQHGAPVADVITNYAGPINTYSMISITFTPTVTNVILDVYFDVWGGSTFNFWVDDVSIT